MIFGLRGYTNGGTGGAFPAPAGLLLPRSSCPAGIPRQEHNREVLWGAIPGFCKRSSKIREALWLSPGGTGFSPCQDLSPGPGPGDSPAAVPGIHCECSVVPAGAAGSRCIPRSCGDGGFFSGMKLFSIQKVQCLNYRAGNRRRVR